MPEQDDNDIVVDHEFVPHHARTFNNGVTVWYCATCSRPGYQHVSHQGGTN